MVSVQLSLFPLIIISQVLDLSRSKAVTWELQEKQTSPNMWCLVSWEVITAHIILFPVSLFHPNLPPFVHLHSMNVCSLLHRFYSRVLNLSDVGVSIASGGCCFGKGSKDWANYERPYLLAVEDPADPTNDVCRWEVRGGLETLCKHSQADYVLAWI